MSDHFSQAASIAALQAWEGEISHTELYTAVAAIEAKEPSTELAFEAAAYRRQLRERIAAIPAEREELEKAIAHVTLAAHFPRDRADRVDIAITRCEKGGHHVG